MGCIVLISNTKSHMDFRLVPKSATLNDLERRDRCYCAILRYCNEFGKFGGQLRQSASR